MNWNIVIAVAMVAVAVLMAILSYGVLLPISLPFVAYGLKMLGIEP